MDIEDYEQYWQKGGTYVLPNEVFNELFYDIEQLQQENDKLSVALDIAEHKINKLIDYEEKDKVIDKAINFIKMIKDESYQSSVIGICDVALKELV